MYKHKYKHEYKHEYKQEYKHKHCSATDYFLFAWQTVNNPTNGVLWLYIVW